METFKDTFFRYKKDFFIVLAFEATTIIASAIYLIK